MRIWLDFKQKQRIPEKLRYALFCYILLVQADHREIRDAIGADSLIKPDQELDIFIRLCHGDSIGDRLCIRGECVILIIVALIFTGSLLEHGIGIDILAGADLVGHAVSLSGLE